MHMIATEPLQRSFLVEQRCQNASVKHSIETPNLGLKIENGLQQCILPAFLDRRHERGAKNLAPYCTQ
jgi:hypothetical protein